MNTKCPKCGSKDIKDFTVSDSSNSSNLLSILFDTVKGVLLGKPVGETMFLSHLGNQASTHYTTKYKCNCCGHVWK